jgi:uncharacterized protein with PIN domain
MNRLKKYRAKSNRDDFSTTGRHIDLMRIHAFASESVEFTEEETAHFDVCPDCRLKLIDALRRNAEAQVVRSIRRKAA